MADRRDAGPDNRIVRLGHGGGGWKITALSGMTATFQRAAR